MIKKGVFEDDLIAGMQRELQSYDKKQGMQNLVKAVEYLQAAAEICEEAGLTVKADQIIAVLLKIADGYDSPTKPTPPPKPKDDNVAAQDHQFAKGKPHKPKNPTTISDRHTHGLTSEKMLENLKQHGIVFNMADDGNAADDLLNLDIGDNELEVTDKEPSPDKTFEDSD